MVVKQSIRSSEKRRGREYMKYIGYWVYVTVGYVTRQMECVAEISQKHVDGLCHIGQGYQQFPQTHLILALLFFTGT